MFLAEMRNTYLMEVIKISGDSMSPVFQDGDRMVLCKYYYKFRSLQKGHIVSATVDGEGMVKRVVACPGDRLFGTDDLIYIKMYDIILEIPRRDVDKYPGIYSPLIIEEGSCFLLGDDYENSHDSRNFGPVPQECINGRYIFRY
jgi:signal peptidase I